MDKNKLNSKYPSDNYAFEDDDKKRRHFEVDQKNTTEFLDPREPSAPEMDIGRLSRFSSKSAMNFDKFNTYIKDKLRAEKSNVPIFKPSHSTDIATKKEENQEDTSFTHKTGLELFDPDCDLKDDTTVDTPNDDDDYQRPAKLGLFVGLLRLVNVLSAVTALFGIAASINIKIDYIWKNATISYDYEDRYDDEPYDEDYGYSGDYNYNEEEENGHFETLVDLGKNWWEKVQAGSGVLLLFLMTIVCLLVLVDNIATVTFRWKQYGELTHRHTDATSIIFLISPSRYISIFQKVKTLTEPPPLQVQSIKYTK